MVIIVMYLIPRLTGSNEATPVVVEQKAAIEKSIAVLPFTNLSGDPEQEYFSDGITDDILNHLSKIHDLRVKSRTSTLKYKNTQTSIGKIGEELEVATILEGTVRKSGNKIRVVAQLIDVNTDEHLWSETYDRELTEIFAIQSDIAGKIADQLKAALSPIERQLVESAPAYNIVAYDFYLKGRAYDKAYQNFRRDNDYDSANKYYRRSLKVDSTIARAHVGLAEIYWTRNSGPYGTELKENDLDSVLIRANRALAQDSLLPQAYALRGKYYSGVKGSREKAIADLDKALVLRPNSGVIYDELGDIYAYEANYESALINYFMALRLSELVH